MFNLGGIIGKNPPKRIWGENPPVIYVSVQCWELWNKDVSSSFLYTCVSIRPSFLYMYSQTTIQVSIINFCIIDNSQRQIKKHGVKCSQDLATVQGGEIALEKVGFPTKPGFPSTWLRHILYWLLVVIGRHYCSHKVA